MNGEDRTRLEEFRQFRKDGPFLWWWGEVLVAGQVGSVKRISKLAVGGCQVYGQARAERSEDFLMGSAFPRV